MWSYKYATRLVFHSHFNFRETEAQRKEVAEPVLHGGEVRGGQAAGRGGDSGPGTALPGETAASPPAGAPHWDAGGLPKGRAIPPDGHCAPQHAEGVTQGHTLTPVGMHGTQAHGTHAEDHKHTCKGTGTHKDTETQGYIYTWGHT